MIVLRTENITKSFGRKCVLKDISFEIGRGTLVGIVGENGSGKSTLLKIIAGQWSSNAGKVIRKGRLGYCPQQALIFPQLTIDEHFRYFSAAYGLQKEKWEPQRELLFQSFNFGQYRSQKVETLSGGTQQKLNLSLALLHEPDLLVLDEPYNGFDWDTYQRFWKLTADIQAGGGAILLVTHLLTDTEQFDKVYQLKKGELL